MIENNSELRAINPNDPNLKYKYRLVFAGNRVKDQNSDVAMLMDLGSSVATMAATKSCDAIACMKGYISMQADCTQAYIQAKFPDNVPETWVAVPREAWPADWENVDLCDPW